MIPNTKRIAEYVDGETSGDPVGDDDPPSVIVVLCCVIGVAVADAGVVLLVCVALKQMLFI